MGKRAKKAPVQTSRKQTLAKRFKCPFCANGTYDMLLYLDVVVYICIDDDLFVWSLV